MARGGAREGDPLFAAAADKAAAEPLAARMRPRNLDDFAGQDHIVGPGRLLRRAIQKDQLSSLIFSGPPGTGKTTLARVIANSTASRFVTLNAVLAGIADIRTAVEEAKQHRELYGRRTILFVDEVHRWNKAQQDALLPWVENGTIVLIGATTENPFFEVNRALVSRSRVFQLKSLEEADLRKVAEAALADPERGYGRWKLRFGEGALEHLLSVAEGDARSLLNALELAVETSAEPWPPAEGAEIFVSLEAAEESIQRRAVLYDKDGDYHYDAASALIKSIRGSDPDAALYWLARMIYAGEDPRFAFRRMLISAAEDIGLADPNALNVVSAAASAFERIGLPEGQFHLAEAALYLATAPKSNSSLGYFDALKAVEAESAEVPRHLKDGNRDEKGFGHGEGYLYPHAYRDHWVAQAYLPESLKGRVFYQPGSLGLEGERRLSILERRESQVAALYEGAELPGEEGLVWSKAGEARSEWRLRAESSTQERFRLMRKGLFERAAPRRHDRILVLDAREGYLIWEALRRSPEGTVVALMATERERDLVAEYASTLPEIERPLFLIGKAEELLSEGSLSQKLDEALGFHDFDLVLGRDLLGFATDPAGLLAKLAEALGREGTAARFLSVESLPREGGRLSLLLAGPEGAGRGASREGRDPQAASGPKGGLRDKLSAFEKAFYARKDLPVLGREGAELEAALAAWGKAAAGPGGGQSAELSLEREKATYARSFSAAELGAWLSPESAFGKALAEAFSAEELADLELLLRAAAARGSVEWPLPLLYFSTRLQSPKAGLET